MGSTPLRLWLHETLSPGKQSSAPEEKAAPNSLVGDQPPVSLTVAGAVGKTAWLVVTEDVRGNQQKDWGRQGTPSWPRDMPLTLPPTH